MKQSRIWVAMIALAIAGCGTSTSLPVGAPPVIQSIEAETLQVRVGASLRLHARVTSESGNLSYKWRTDHGMVANPKSESTVWVAPERVTYNPQMVTIQLTVKDEYGRTTRAMQTIQVYR